ncbi:hypothetical protein A5721_13175 [Mycobacterium vulneris]|nr:hypothetical protein A5721_13175 [Mycolicibacterium vulneris]
MDRTGNRHFSFGLGVHRCIGSNAARTVFKVDAHRGARPDTGLPVRPGRGRALRDHRRRRGLHHLAATFTPGRRIGPGLADILENLQRICDEQQLAAPITVHKATAVID